MYREVVCDDGSIYVLPPLLQLQLIQKTFFITYYVISQSGDQDVANKSKLSN